MFLKLIWILNGRNNDRYDGKAQCVWAMGAFEHACYLAAVVGYFGESEQQDYSVLRLLETDNRRTTTAP